MSTTLKTWLLAGVLALVAATVLGIVTLNRVTTEDVLVEQMDQVMDKVAAESVARTESHFAPADQVAELTQGLVGSDVLDATDVAVLEPYFFEQLAVAPELDGMFVGYPDGGMVYLARDDTRVEDGFRFQVIDVSSDGRSNTISYLDAEGELVEVERDDADPFDPRTRPWYLAAGDTDDLVWTEPYVFYAYLTPGVTAATSLETATGETVGVFGVDTRLDALSDFVSELDVSENGEAFLVDSGGGLLAYPDPEAVVRPTENDDEEYRLSTTAELGDALAAGSFENFDAADVAPDESYRASFTAGGQASQAVFVPLEDGDDWYVAVAAPKHDFVGRIHDSVRNNAILAVAVGLAVVVLSIPAVRFVAHLFQRTRERADTDALTGLANRRVLEEALGVEVRRAQETDSSFAVGSIDVDLFKQINDTHGHGVGDEALVAVANRLVNGVRDGDTVCRTGGDEFAVVLPGASHADAAEILERVRAVLADSPTNTSKGEISITLTIGTAAWEPTMGDADDLLEAADEALYLAKESGRNRVATPDGLVDRTGGSEVPSAEPTGAPPAG